MDAQANLSYCMVPDHQIRTQEREGRTAYHLLRSGFRTRRLDIGDYITQPPLVVSNVSRGGSYGTAIHMVVSTPSVAQLDEDLLKLWLAGKDMPPWVRQTVLNALEPALDRYDYILIDCPPGLSLFSSAALIASDYYISPVIPEPLSLQGVDLVQERQRQLMQMNEARAEFRGVILNVVKHYRNTHSRVSEQIFFGDRSRYEPFDYWLPDNERLRTIGEYDPDIKGKWAGGSEHKFADIHHKYGLSYRLTNPVDGSLNREETEGREYRLEDRISSLVEEFIRKCQPHPQQEEAP